MTIHIIGGGTFSHVRNHLALAAPAFGGTARQMSTAFLEHFGNLGQHDQEVRLHLTKMADPASKLVTNHDVAYLVEQLVADPDTRVIVMNAALCDYDGSVVGPEWNPDIGQPLDQVLTPSGKYETRLKTAAGDQILYLSPADKIISRIRKVRKDIFLVAFKTTTGATPDEQYAAGLHLLKANSANLVLANDTVNYHNMVVTPEEARYHEGGREAAIQGLVDMTILRSANTFTRSTVVDGPPVPWGSDLVPENLRTVVNHCIVRGAYKPFRGATVGHFAAKIDDGSIVTSRRKRDFNRLPEEGLIRVDYEGDDRVIAQGGKPSVGGQSQRIIFREHPDAECIVHFHCPPKPEVADKLSHVDQRPNECGSHQCGAATSRGLIEVGGGIKAVMLDNHGPNIVFSRNTPAEDVIAFIEDHFHLGDKTGGLVA